MLATELGLSRSRIAALSNTGGLEVAGGDNTLKRSPRDGRAVRLAIEDRAMLTAAIG